MSKEIISRIDELGEVEFSKMLEGHIIVNKDVTTDNILI